MLLNSKRHIDRRGAEVNMVKFTVHVYRNISQQLYYIINLSYAFPVILDH